ncbi:hypothetical protein JL193_03795 [Polaribacter batillariae]|uniref:Bacteriocin-type signal sequence-containing protein n=1 Tax=Polaribacter batillariae TaxID=2808900 RepID=A0ABX7SYS6_9FLAO|nr:hypothetical protein [Polaribacter batillariae]QTD38430.1 hypothetical protein JL193_03795 [Polaribacter batillariae]
MKNLQNFGVQELNAKEISETKGGGPIADFVHWWVHTMDKYAPGYVHTQYGV